MFLKRFRQHIIFGLGWLVLCSSVMAQGNVGDEIRRGAKVPKGGLCQAYAGDVADGIRLFKCDHLGEVKTVQEIYDAGFRIVGISHDARKTPLVFLVIEERR